MANLTPWRKIAEPHRDIREERFDPAVFAADLGMVLRDEGPLDYRDPLTFFKKTYLTQGLSGLLQDTLDRLSGGPRGEAVVQIQIPFGGGKTHVLIALYHLLAHPDQIQHLESIQGLLEEAGLEAIPECRIAALVGTALDAHGRKTEEGIQVKTLWGEMAYQLGGPDLYERIKDRDQDRTAPGTNKLMDLLEGQGPVLILVDEALEYATKAGGVEVGGGTLLGQTLAFLQELSGVAANRPQTMLVGAIPSSYLERYDESAEKAFQQLNKIFGRMEQIRSPVRGDEIYEIIGRRLFEDVGSEAERRDVVESVWGFYQDHADDLPRRVTEVSYRERMMRCYPFHPELVDILYERWGSLPNFQRTRGVLRLLALVTGSLYKRSSPAALIQPAHVDLSEGRIRREFVKLAGASYETVIGSDIASHAAKAPRIDQELGGQYAQDGIVEGLATSIFLYSHTGGADRGGTLPQLRLSLLHPEMTPALVADALDRLSNRLWYLYKDPKWRFDTVPNLNQIRVEREDAVGDEEIRTRIHSTLSDLAGRQAFKRIYLWPQEDRDVADNRDLGLVILDPEYTAGDEEADEFISAVLKRHGSAFRTYRNTLVFLAPNGSDVESMRAAARTLIALEGIAVDYGGGDRLTDQQQEKLEKDLDDARSALPQRVSQAYRHIVIPGEEDSFLRFDIGLQLWREGHSLSQQVWEHLVSRDRLLERLDPHLIRAKRWDLWPEKDQPLQVSQLRDYFARYTQLPMLASEDVLIQTIAQGVEAKLFGYGRREDEEADFAPLFFDQTLAPHQVEITDTAWLIPPDMARELSLGSISGCILDTENEPMAGVTVRLSPSGQTAVTGNDGVFEFTELALGSYSIAPSRSGFAFSPASRSVSVDGEDVTGLEFVGQEVKDLPTYALSGGLRTEQGQPLEGVRIALDPPVAGEVSTDARGSYTFQELQERDYTIRPYKSGFTFDPPQITVTVDKDVGGQNFVAQKEEKERGRSLEVQTEIPWESWYDFYGDMLDPLMSLGAEIDISLTLQAVSDTEFDSDLIERLRDVLRKYDQDGNIKVSED